MNGIQHGDISYNNLMYDLSAKTDEPVGIVNDFDLATWVNRSTTNNDRTGTIPFMALDLLNGGLDHRTPRLYRHDMESFAWVLAYITVANIEYEDGTIKISPLPKVDTWFKDNDQSDRDAHILSKQYLYSEYGHSQEVSGRYHHYLDDIRQIIHYWSDFHRSLQARMYVSGPLRPTPNPVRKVPVPSKPEADDPTGSLRLFVAMVAKSFGVGGGLAGEGRFAEVKSLLLEAIETPTVVVKVV